MAAAVTKLSCGDVQIRFNSIDLGTTRWKEGAFEILEKDNKSSLSLRFNCGGPPKTFQVNMRHFFIFYFLIDVLLFFNSSNEGTARQIWGILHRSMHDTILYLKRAVLGKTNQIGLIGVGVKHLNFNTVLKLYFITVCVLRQQRCHCCF